MSKILSQEEFKKKYPVGAQIDYNGSTYVVWEHYEDDPENYYLRGFKLVPEPEGLTTFTPGEDMEAIFEPVKKKTALPIDQPPSQVFLLAWLDKNGHPRAKILRDLQEIKDHGGIPAGAVLNAITDPGTPVPTGDARTLVLQILD